MGLVCDETRQLPRDSSLIVRTPVVGILPLVCSVVRCIGEFGETDRMETQNSQFAVNQAVCLDGDSKQRFRFGGYVPSQATPEFFKLISKPRKNKTEVEQLLPMDQIGRVTILTGEKRRAAGHALLSA